MLDEDRLLNTISHQQVEINELHAVLEDAAKTHDLQNELIDLQWWAIKLLAGTAIVTSSITLYRFISDIF